MVKTELGRHLMDKESFTGKIAQFVLSPVLKRPDQVRLVEALQARGEVQEGRMHASSGSAGGDIQLCHIGLMGCLQACSLCEDRHACALVCIRHLMTVRLRRLSICCLAPVRR